MVASADAHQIGWVASGGAFFDWLAVVNVLSDREAAVAVPVDVFA